MPNTASTAQNTEDMGIFETIASTDFLPSMLTTGPGCDCPPLLPEFNLPPPPDPFRFMERPEGFRLETCSSLPSFVNVEDILNSDYLPGKSLGGLSEYLAFIVSAAIAAGVFILGLAIALCYCKRKGKCPFLFGKRASSPPSLNLSGSYPLPKAQAAWSYNSFKHSKAGNNNMIDFKQEPQQMTEISGLETGGLGLAMYKGSSSTEGTPIDELLIAGSKFIIQQPTSSSDQHNSSISDTSVELQSYGSYNAPFPDPATSSHPTNLRNNSCSNPNCRLAAGNSQQLYTTHSMLYKPLGLADSGNYSIDQVPIYEEIPASTAEQWNNHGLTVACEDCTAQATIARGNAAAIRLMQNYFASHSTGNLLHHSCTAEPVNGGIYGAHRNNCCHGYQETPAALSVPIKRRVSGCRHGHPPNAHGRVSHQQQHLKISQSTQSGGLIAFDDDDDGERVQDSPGCYQPNGHAACNSNAPCTPAFDNDWIYHPRRPSMENQMKACGDCDDPNCSSRRAVFESGVPNGCNLRHCHTLSSINESNNHCCTSECTAGQTPMRSTNKRRKRRPKDQRRISTAAVAGSNADLQFASEKINNGYNNGSNNTSLQKNHPEQWITVPADEQRRVAVCSPLAIFTPAVSYGRQQFGGNLPNSNSKSAFV